MGRSLVKGSRTVTVASNLNQITENFVCDYLELEEPIEVRDGDILGACLPAVSGNQTLQIVSASDEGATDLMSGSCTVDLPDNVRRNSLSTDMNRILHLYADINNDFSTESVSEPFDDMPETTSQMEVLVTSATTMLSTDVRLQDTVPTDSSTGSEMESRTEEETSQNPLENQNVDTLPSVGGVVAGVVSTVLLVVAGGTVTVIVVVLLVVRKKRKCYYSKQNSRLATNNFTSLNNAIYGIGSQYSGNEAPITSHVIPDTSAPIYAEPQTNHRIKESRGKNDEGYYSPDSVMYSGLLAKDMADRDLNPYEAPASQENELYAQLKYYNINKISRKELISVQQHLGSGQFGLVERGKWTKDGTTTEVAIKTLKEGTEQNKIEFLQEAVTMAQFKHPNVIFLYGVAHEGEDIMLVTEYAHRGDLKGYLTSMKSVSIVPTNDLPKLLLEFSQQISMGMNYLSGKGFIHRDLAARNILVTDDKICKVADFGMSRDLSNEDYYISTGGKVPLKWTAPESLYYMKYSTASDVWSYGCVLYEIWSLGTKPYYRIKNEAVIDFIDSGKRLTPPPGCSRMIYQLMISCWHPDISSRPSFNDISSALIGNDKLVLEIPPEAENTHPQAGVIGAAIEAGAEMYPDLTNQYSRYSPIADINTPSDSDDINNYENITI